MAIACIQPSAKLVSLLNMTLNIEYSVDFYLNPGRLVVSILLAG